MFKKMVAVVLLLSVTGIVLGQETQEKKRQIKSDTWILDVNLGATHFTSNEPTFSNLKDNVNVGLDLGVTYTFKSNLYASLGGTFSLLEDGPFDLWDNPLTYYSFNADIGYKFDTGGLSQPYLAVGGSFIGAPNTIDGSSGTFSVNLTGGFLFWLRDSNWGITIQNTYRYVDNTDMVPHNRFTFGVRYRL